MNLRCSHGSGVLGESHASLVRSVSSIPPRSMHVLNWDLRSDPLRFTRWIFHSNGHAESWHRPTMYAAPHCGREQQGHREEADLVPPGDGTPRGDVASRP